MPSHLATTTTPERPRDRADGPPKPRVLCVDDEPRLLEGQAMGTDATLKTPRARSGRHDGSLLERFAQLQGAST